MPSPQKENGVIPWASKESPRTLGIIYHPALKKLCRARHNCFTPQAFNLFAEVTLDGERIARERAEAERARRAAESAQASLFTPENPNENS
jgi:hypothetical protein